MGGYYSPTPVKLTGSEEPPVSRGEHTREARTRVQRERGIGPSARQIFTVLRAMRLATESRGQKWYNRITQDGKHI